MYKHVHTYYRKNIEEETEQTDKRRKADLHVTGVANAKTLHVNVFLRFDSPGGFSEFSGS